MKKTTATPPARASRFHQLIKRQKRGEAEIVVEERHQGGRAVSGSHSKRKNRKRKVAAASRRRNRC